MVLVQGMRTMALEQSWSITNRIESCPWDGGRSVMKSMLTWENGNEFLSAEIGMSGGEVGW